MATTKTGPGPTRLMFIDSRAGSSELRGQLARVGVPGELTTLDYGDFVFPGYGLGNREVLVAVERKTLSDLLQSIQGGRLLSRRQNGKPGQVEGMLTSYDECYLLVEGVWKAGRNGELLVPKWGGWQEPLGAKGRGYAWLSRFLISLSEQTSMRVVRTGDEVETIYLLKDLFMWWGKKWTEHTSLGGLGAIPHEGGKRRQKKKDAAGAVVKVKTEPDEKYMVRSVARYLLPGIGDETVKAVVQEFRNLQDMVLAGEDRWKRVGVMETRYRKIRYRLTGKIL